MLRPLIQAGEISVEHPIDQPIDQTHCFHFTLLLAWGALPRSGYRIAHDDRFLSDTPRSKPLKLINQKRPPITLMNDDKLNFIAHMDFSTVDVQNISGKLLRCRIAFPNGTGVQLLLDVGTTFTMTGLKRLPKVDAEYVLDGIADKLN